MNKLIRFCPLPFVIFLFSGCGDDDPEKGESLVSQYKIKSAVLTNDVTTSLEDVSLSAGTDITTAIILSFFDEIDCADNSGKGLELTANNQILYLCLFEDYAEEKGSWSINEDRTSLTLTLNIQDQLVPLQLTDLQETSTTVSGIVEQIPVPPTLLSFVDGEFLRVPDPTLIIGINLSLDKLD